MRMIGLALGSKTSRDRKEQLRFAVARNAPRDVDSVANSRHSRAKDAYHVDFQHTPVCR
jgi:hypothetical protein